MKSLRLLVAVLAVLSAAALASQPTHDETVDELVERTNKATHDIFKFEERINARLDPARIRRAGSLRARVEALEDPSCPEHSHQCGGDDPQCISDLFVCDGHKDCRNGEDEARCKIPTKAGDRFVGDLVFDHCTQRRPEHITLFIESVTTASYFTAFPSVHVHLEIDTHSDEEEREASLPAEAIYSFAENELTVFPPEDDGLYFHAKFDGYNPDRFVGDITHTSSEEACARFIFHRKD